MSEDKPKKTRKKKPYNKFDKVLEKLAGDTYSELLEEKQEEAAQEE